ncbi:MAG: hypothetical protein LUG62_00840 [Clostridiales bacterium]|nr:hypothetical protein [Clostridiales bacterium]
MKKWVVTDPETLRTLCIKNRWFTNGSNEQYDKMFALNADENYALKDLALVIWMCSDDIPYSDIYSDLDDANDDYLMEIALAQPAEGERAADEIYCGYYD